LRRAPTGAEGAQDRAGSFVRLVGWGAGETFTYSVKLAGIEGGRVAISVGKPGASSGKRNVKLRGFAETIPFISAFAHMSEEVVTLVDLVDVLPLRSKLDRKAPDNDRLLEIAFGITMTKQKMLLRGRTYHSPRAIRGPLYDPISAFFLLRSLPLEPGTKLGLIALNGIALYRCEVRVTGRERLYTRLGAVDTLRIEGEARLIFDDGKEVAGKPPRRFVLWLSDDARRLPVQASGDTTLGRVEAFMASHHAAETPFHLRLSKPLAVTSGSSDSLTR
jgi:hypothetical protein